MRPGEGERIGGPCTVTIVATGAGTGGTRHLGEARIAPGFPGPPPHVHERVHDMFYLLDGTLTVRIGDRTEPLGPGSFVCIPPGVSSTRSATTATGPSGSRA